MEKTAANIDLLSDYAIVQRVVSGRKHEFELLIRRFNQQLFRIGIAYLKNDIDTQDAMQSAYLKAYEKLSTFRADASFSTWLIRIMINECLLLIRRKEHQRIDDSHRLLKSFEPDGVQKLITTEMKDILEKAILSLPEKYRTIYIFRALNEFSTADTAEFLGLTTENVKIRLHRAKQLLREEIIKQTDAAEPFIFLGTHCEAITGRVMALVLTK